MGGTPAKVRHVLEHTDETMAQTGGKIRSYLKEHSEFEEIGERMLKEWEQGAVQSLRPTA